MKAFVQPSLSSTTFIHRNEILTLRFYILSTGEYSIPNTLTIQLWSNLKKTNWNGINFTEKNDEVSFGCEEEKYRVFEVEVGTKDIEEGWYGFTIRVHSSVWSDDGEWKWLSESKNNNGRIFVGRPKESGLKVISTTSGSKKGIESIFNEHTFNHVENLQTSRNVDSWCASMNMILSKECFIYRNLGKPKDLVRYFGLERMTNWWLIPTTGSEKLNISSKDVQYLIIQQTSGNYVALIPLTNENYYSALKSDDSGELIIKCAINNSKCDKEVEVKLIISRGKELGDLVKSCMEAVKKITFQEEAEKKILHDGNYGIAYYDKLGYCTWNAFYDKVGEEDLLQALRSLHNAGIQIGYVILDDGWQRINKNREMQGFEANLEKFPNGLKRLIDKMKKEFPYIEDFGVW